MATSRKGFWSMQGWRLWSLETFRWGGVNVIKIKCMKFSKKKSIFEMWEARQERRHWCPKLTSSNTCQGWNLIRGPELSGAGDSGIQERPQQGFPEKPYNEMTKQDVGGRNHRGIWKRWLKGRGQNVCYVSKILRVSEDSKASREVYTD